MATRSLPLTNKRQPKIPHTKAGLFLQILEFLLKVTGLSISLLGVLAWIAGACYRYGFWEAANNAGPLSAATLQETALHGFISPFATWMRAVGAILALSVITALSGLRVKFNFPKPIAARPPAWLSSRMGYDKSYAGLAWGSWWLLAFYFLLCCIHLLTGSSIRIKLDKLFSPKPRAATASKSPGPAALSWMAASSFMAGYWIAQTRC